MDAQSPSTTTSTSARLSSSASSLRSSVSDAPVPDTITACPACTSQDTRLIFKSQLACGVRSNAQFLQYSAELWSCSQCALIFKPLPAVRAVSDYVDYAAMNNNPDQDKLDFSNGKPQERSLIFKRYLNDLNILNEQTRVLDYGCHRGAFLKLLDANMQSAGFDMSLDYAPIIRGLGFDYYTPNAPLPQQAFDLVTLIHVAEHLEDLQIGFAKLLPMLKANAVVAIQVPDIEHQFTDAYILDHRSHFSAQTLDGSMAAAGFVPLKGLVAPKSLVAGELTGVYRVDSVGGSAVSANGLMLINKAQQHAQVAVDLVAALKRCERSLIQLKQKNYKLWVYGAGNLGALVAGFLGEQVLGFVDDNPKLYEDGFQGYPVVSPLDPVMHDAQVVIAVPPLATASVVRRCQARRFRVQAPFS